MDDLATTGDILRVRSWDEYIGQEPLKEKLTVSIQSALNRYAKLDHQLLIAPPGFGKTSLAGIIANLLREDFAVVKMPIDETRFVQCVRQWQGGVMLLDELHSASARFQEFLLPAIEDGFLQVPRTGVLEPTTKCTFIGATTEPQKIIKPLLDRFLSKPDFVEYTDEDMEQIIRGMAARLSEQTGVELVLSEELVTGIRKAAGGTPRVASQLIVAARDLVVTRRDLTVEGVLFQSGLDADGLTMRHLEYLRVLGMELGGQSGLKTLVTMLQTSAPVLEEMERLLIKRGFMYLSPQGRSITSAGMKKVRETSDRTGGRFAS